jgi:hypothetical protein
MTEPNHDEIARRLRETGTVPAPDRLRDEVMSQVRAEPRLRRRRRSFVVPVLPYAAAAAAAIVVAVLAVSHLGGGSGSMSSGAAGASGGGGGTRSVEAGKGAAGPPQPSRAQDQAIFSVAPFEALKLAHEARVKATRSPKAIVIAVPHSLYADYRKRLARIERRTPGGPTIRVILRAAPRR